MFGKYQKCFVSLRKLKKIKKQFIEKELLTLHLKNMDSSTSVSETNENVFLFVFISPFVSFGVLGYMQHFFDSLRKQANRKATENTYQSCPQENQKFIKRMCHMKWFCISSNEKYFPKSIRQIELNYDLITKLPRTIVACNFFSISFKFKRGILLLSTK